MNYAALTTKLTPSKIFTKLGNNTGSVVPMYVKDIVSDTATSLTYFKEGGDRDGIEKTFEEFTTGALWLGGIPAIKKFIFDKKIFPHFGINSDVSPEKIFASNKKNAYNTLEFALNKASELGEDFSEQATVIKDTLKNKELAKNLNLAKFGISTALTGALLYLIITLKQKSTEKAIAKKIKEENAKELALKTALKNNDTFNKFTGEKKEVSFKGLGSIGTFFMTNPIANTTLVDGVITGTRLAQARKGERGEVGFKEGSQLAFIYALAYPLQRGLELASEKLFKKPIDLDYSVFESNIVKSAINQEKTEKGSSDLIKQAKKLVELAGNEHGFLKGFKKISQEKALDVTNFIFDKNNKTLTDTLIKSGVLESFTTSEGIEQVSLLGSVNPKAINNASKKIIKLVENATNSKDTLKYLKGTKALKIAAIVLNIGISAFLMGYLQPKMNLHFRKKTNNGDKTNPAIRQLEQEMRQKFSFEGSKKTDEAALKA